MAPNGCILAFTPVHSCKRSLEEIFVQQIRNSGNRAFKVRLHGLRCFQSCHQKSRPVGTDRGLALKSGAITDFTWCMQWIDIHSPSELLCFLFILNKFVYLEKTKNNKNTAVCIITNIQNRNAGLGTLHISIYKHLGIGRNFRIISIIMHKIF